MADFMFQNVAYRATVYRTGEISPAKPCHLYMFKKEFLISKSFWKAKSDSDTTFGNEETFSTFKTFLDT